ncbi:MAG: hypothetical protein HC800_23310 [Phormidesmis sp. RL_2_1]|nr:hypothetical protein [Phormidesmis sp. RL_2_1]
MFLLTREDVDITNIQHPKKAQKVPILSYQDKTFRLLKVFQSSQHTEAQALFKDLTDSETKPCVLLEEPFRYSIWRQIHIDMDLLQPSVPAAYGKACVLLVQALYSDVEQFLGDNQAKKFAIALERKFPQLIQSIGGLGGLLRINPLMESIPVWEESELSSLLLELHRLGTRFFGQSQFTSRTLSALDELPADDQTVFFNWLELSLLNQLWLA